MQLEVGSEPWGVLQFMSLYSRSAVVLTGNLWPLEFRGGWQHGVGCLGFSFINILDHLVNMHILILGSVQELGLMHILGLLLLGNHFLINNHSNS